MSRCTTTHGAMRCEHEEGHGGDCEAQMPEYTRFPRLAPPADLDTQRELRRAAAHISVLAKALEQIRTTPCEAKTGAACMCCVSDRIIATNALKVLG